jgi:hypothetical protein
MRRVVVLALLALALALPIVASAGTLDITNKFGSASITTAGVVVGATQYSHLMSWGGIHLGSMGRVTFSTGAFSGTSVLSNGTFAGGAGTTFIVTGVGAWTKTLPGSPQGPVTLFSGSFVGPVTWTKVGGGCCGSIFELVGKVTGTLWNGRVVSGTTTQTFVASNKQFMLGIGHFKEGDTQFAVPEPGTLGLLGTGLVGIAGMFRRKLMRA